MIINILARLLYGKGGDNVDVLWAHLILMGKDYVAPIIVVQPTNEELSQQQMAIMMGLADLYTDLVLGGI